MPVKTVRIDQRVIDAELKTQAKEQPKTRREIADSDCPGLHLALNANGSTSWTYSYRPRGGTQNTRTPQRTITFGDLTTHSPAAARAEVDGYKAAIRNGRDPASERKAKIEAERLAKLRELNIDQAADLYIRQGLLNEKRPADEISTEDALRTATKHKREEAANLRMAIAEMNVGTSKLRELARADTQRLLDHYPKRSAVARRRFGALSRFCDWHVGRDALPINPCSLIPRKDRPRAPKPREHVYKAAEIQSLWHAADKFDEVGRDFLRLMVLMPFRRQEASELMPGNLDAGRDAIVLHGVLTKNGDEFMLPTCPAAREIVDRRISASGKRRARLFPFNSAGNEMNTWTAYGERIGAATGIKDFGWHDLRRTFNTELAEHGIGDPDTVDACLNHRQSNTRGGVRGVYNRAALTAKKEAVMKAWGELVAHAVEHGAWPRETERASNVVPLHAAAV